MVATDIFTSVRANILQVSICYCSVHGLSGFALSRLVMTMLFVYVLKLKDCTGNIRKGTYQEIIEEKGKWKKEEWENWKMEEWERGE